MEDYYHRQHKQRVWEIADEFDLDARTAEILDLILRGRFDPIQDLKDADFALKSLIRLEEEEAEAMRSDRPDDLPTLRPTPKSADASNALFANSEVHNGTTEECHGGVEAPNKLNVPSGIDIKASEKLGKIVLNAAVYEVRQSRCGLCGKEHPGNYSLADQVI